MRLENKTAIITGAGSKKGIGRAIAERFAHEGANVIVAGLESVEETANAIQAVGGTAIGVKLDVTDRNAVSEAIARVEKMFGDIHILVNNAGFCTFKPFLKLDDELWDRTFAVNVKGYFIFGQLVANHMVTRGIKGKIINMSSVSAKVSGEHKVHYSASKAAVSSLTQGMALELARYSINVNAIGPGTIDTDIIRDDYILQIFNQEREHAPGIPLGRVGVGSDITGAAVYLASCDSDYMTGNTIYIDGGMLAGTTFEKQ